MTGIETGNLEISGFKKYTIFVAEDDGGLRLLIQKKLESEGLVIKAGSTGKEILEFIRSNKSEILVLIDYHLPDINTKDLIQIALNENLNIPFIIMTGYGDERLAVDMMKLGVKDYLVKEMQIF